MSKRELPPHGAKGVLAVAPDERVQHSATLQRNATVGKAPHPATAQRREGPFGMPKTHAPHPTNMPRVVVQPMVDDEETRRSGMPQPRELQSVQSVVRPHAAHAIQRSSSSISSRAPTSIKVLSWNSCGARIEAISRRLKEHDPDVMVVQEAGNLGELKAWDAFADVMEGAYYELDTFKKAGYRTYWMPWVRTLVTKDGKAQTRCSMAIISKEAMEQLRVVDIMEAKVQPRPVFWGVYKSSWAICNVHAGGLEYIQATQENLKHCHQDRRRITVGDYNQPPDKVKKLFECNKESVVAALDQDGKTFLPTRPSSGSTLDFAVCGKGVTGKAELCTDYSGSDHRTVSFTFVEDKKD